MTDGRLPDAPRQNWVDRSAPEALKPWLKLGRFDRPIGIWLLLIPGWQGIALAMAQYRAGPFAYHLWLLVAFAIGAILMRAAGCAFNDVVDRDIDRQVARTADRPVASGRISVKQAMVFIAVCCFVSLLILLTLPETAIWLGVASLLLVAGYPFMKRITWWPQAWLGLTFNWGVLMGFAASVVASAGTILPMDMLMEYRAFFWDRWLMPSTDHAVSLHPSVYQSALVFYFGLVFWTLGYDTIYALQDIEDDAMVGVKSSARRLGAKAREGVAFFYLLAGILAAGAGAMAGLGPLFWLGLGAYGLHLAWQVRSLTDHDPARALALFKSNREAGLLLLAAIVLGGLSWS